MSSQLIRIARSIACLFAIIITSVASAQPYDWSSVVIKGNGFIDGIVYSPAAPNTVYINTDMGGAYRWDEKAARWMCMTDWARCDDDSAKHFGVETVAADPTDSSRVYMSVGTYMSPAAIMRSTDGGRSFQRTNVRIKANGNGSARNTGQRMVVDPNQPSILFYGTRVDGLWKSTDRASSWSPVASFPTIGHNEGWGKDTGLLFVHFDTTSSHRGNPTRVIYVGVFDPTQGVPRIYRSTDAGETWAALPGEQYTDANTFPQRMALAADGKTAFITFAKSTTYPGPYGLSDGRVFKINNPAGEAPRWTNVTPTDGCAFSAATFDPAHADVIYISEINDYHPADRIWRSTNSGETWTALNPNSHRDDSSAPYARNARIHWMGDFEIDPFNYNTAMFTTGYGLYRTTNLSALEPTWTFFNEGFEQTACSELVSPNSGPVHLMSAIGDRDGYRHDDFNQSPVLGAHGENQGLTRGGNNDIAVAFDDSRVVLRAMHSSPYIQYSLDNAVTWQWMPDAPVDVHRSGDIAVSADGTHAVWSPIGNGVFVSSRRGDGWTDWKASQISDGAIDGAHLIAEPSDAKIFYAYSGTSAYQSSDSGETWNRLTSEAPANLRWIRAVPGFKGHLWADGHGEVGLWRSTDGGGHWTRIHQDTIPAANVVGIGAPASAGRYPSVFIGGQANGTSGVFRSDDQGETWNEITDPQHEYGYLTVIQGDPRVFGRVYLGTNGRGILCGDLHQAPQQQR